VAEGGPVTAALDSHQLALIGQALHRPMISDADARARVIVWHKGRRHDNARLVYWPPRPGGRHRARIEFPNGSRLSVSTSCVWLVDPHVAPLLTEQAMAELDLDAALSAAEADREALS
jgi:hypothetical protein